MPLGPDRTPRRGLLGGLLGLFAAALGWSVVRSPKAPPGQSWWRWRVPARLVVAVVAVTIAWALSLQRLEHALAIRYLLINGMTLLPIACVLLVSWPEWTLADDENR